MGSFVQEVRLAIIAVPSGLKNLGISFFFQDSLGQS